MSELRKTDPYASLRLRDYRYYAMGALLSILGEQMLDVAIGWEVYERTNSASALGFIGLAEALPFILLAPIGGHASDRHSRRAILVITQSLLALCSLALVALSVHEGPVSLLYLVIAIAGAARAFKSPARSALLPLLVPKELLANAVMWNSSTFQVASVAGPMLGGLLVAAFHKYSIVYGLNALFAVSFLVFLAMIPAPPPPPEKSSREKLSWQSLWAGAHFIRKTPLLLSAITLDLFAVLLGGATALLPIFAKDVLHVDATGLGWLRAAPAIGAFVTAVLLAHIPARFNPLKHSGPALMWVVAGFGAATIGFGLSKSFWFSMAMLFLTGMFDNVSVVIRSTMLQLFTPDSMRGRVSAINYVFIGASNELGAFESGVTAAAFGPVAAVVGGGIGTILVVLGVMWKWPETLDLKELEAAK